MAKSNERAPIITPIYIGSLASTMNVILPGVYFRKHSRIKSVTLLNGAAVSKSNSNYLTLTLQDNAGSPVAYAAAATSDNAVVANTQYALAISTDADNSAQAVSEEADVPAGTVLTAKVVGTGTAVTTNAVLLIEHYPL